MTKRGVILADLHCGHLAGLTPPAWQTGLDGVHRSKLARFQRELWTWYVSRVQELGSLDFVFANGDLIDGRGEASGGTELLTTDRREQCQIAIAALKPLLGRHTKMVMTYGTAYHTGDGEDFEADIAGAFGAKIGSHEWVEVEGVTFDLKHHIGTSSIPHGRHTPIARDKLWADIWADMGRTPRSQVVIRSHVHYFEFCGDARTLCITTPAMQGYSTKYGARRCSGIVDVGFLYFECSKGEYSWRPILCAPRTLTVEPIRL